MLYINPNTPKIITAKRAFYAGMLAFVCKRVDKIDELKGVNVAVIHRFFENHVFDLIDDILLGKPDRLVQISNYLNPFIEFSYDVRQGIEYVFNYDVFIKKAKSRYDAYKLADSLDVRTCTYCNRNYTNTVIRNDGDKLTRPQFDHYFDKATYPVLAISFYNLIPSCSICNSSVKGTQKMNLADYMHPYLDNNLNDIRFTYKYSLESKSGLRILVKTPPASKASNSVKAFAIEEVYNSHTGELLDLIKTRQYFSDRYLSILSSNLLRDVIVSKEDLYRIVFGTEFDSDNFMNRPFSKFKRDILKELGII
ncbi:MAG: hypothetical protein HYZ44_00115 [Bacteroidetes bacterium]|nr:hypothetical protein [Bacteroidota bacterium]